MLKALQESQKQAADDQKQIAGFTSEQALSKKAATETQKVLTESQSKIKVLEKQLVDSALAQSVKDKSLQEAQQKLADNQKQRGAYSEVAGSQQATGGADKTAGRPAKSAA